jgi:hypothetical protein
MSVKTVKFGGREFELLDENRFSERVFEAVAARGSAIMNALDDARRAAFERREGLKEKPAYKHTILLGKDDGGRNLRATIAVFNNSVVVQSFREI